MSHLEDNSQKIIAVKNISNVVADGGYLIIQVNSPFLYLIESEIEKSFIQIKKIKYKGSISGFIETNLSSSIQSTKIGFVMNQILSYVDFGLKEEVMLLYKKITI